MTPSERTRRMSDAVSEYPFADDALLGDAKDLEDTALERALKRTLERKPILGSETHDRQDLYENDGSRPFLLDPPTPPTDPVPLEQLAAEGFTDAAIELERRANHRSILTDARTLPRTLDEAMQSLAIVEESYAESVDTFMTAFEAWQKADLIQARTRVQCVKDLMRPVGETPMSAGLSASAAEKQASDHPTYTNAKDHVAELALVKAEAEADRDLLLQSLKNARAILYAHIAREGARAV